MTETGISIQSLRTWVRLYRKFGEEGLKPKPRGKPRPPKLPAPVTAKIIELKKENPSFEIKRISQFLRRCFFLKASPETVRQKLHRADLMKPRPKNAPQLPISRPTRSHELVVRTAISS